MDSLFNIYVVWSLGGEHVTTLLQYEDTDMQRQAMKDWSVQYYVEQAFHREFPEEPNAITNGDSYVCAAIFEAVGKNKLRFIY